ncbi:MAG: polyprenyl diphosphate synthase [Pseudomonadota bacterium]
MQHVAIIMDGNGRWAESRFHPRIWGHVRGSSVVSQVVEEAKNIKLKALTLYAFSTENWGRPVEEVRALFKLLKKYILKERNRIIKNQIRFKIIGDISNLSTDLKELIIDLEEKTKEMPGLKLNFAFSYGSHLEIVNAVNKFIKENPGKEINEEELSANLFAPECGDVDLLIRTGGDQRISNFLLWQAAYAELYFTTTAWPQFGPKEFRQICQTVGKRQRRFGGLGINQNYQKVKIIAEEHKKELSGEKS